MKFLSLSCLWAFQPSENCLFFLFQGYEINHDIISRTAKNTKKELC